MARCNGVTVSITAILFGAVAVVLSLTAYATRIKQEDVRGTSTSCSYPPSPSVALSILAALALLVEQVIISVGIKCICCGETRCPGSCCGITSVVFFILSWILFVNTFIGLLAGASVNSRSYIVDNDCKIFNEYLFLGTSIWCIVTIVLGLVAFFTFKADANSYRSYKTGGYLTNEQSNIAMGVPQIQQSYNIH